jgi:hypothetical protein
MDKAVIASGADGQNFSNLTEMLRQRGNRVVTNEQFAHWSYAFACLSSATTSGSS